MEREDLKTLEGVELETWIKILLLQGARIEIENGTCRGLCSALNLAARLLSNEQPGYVHRRIHIIRGNLIGFIRVSIAPYSWYEHWVYKMYPRVSNGVRGPGNLTFAQVGRMNWIDHMVAGLKEEVNERA